MVLNLLVHISAGILGRNIFNINFPGISWCFLFVAIVQGVDMIRVYRYHKKRVDQATPHLREEQMIKFRRRAPIIMPQIYIVKVLLYGAVTLVAASIMRGLVL